MKLFKEKTILLSPIIVLIVALIFSLTMAPSINPTPKNLPIAIVNEDQGVEIPNQGSMNMGNTIVENIEQVSKAKLDEEPAIHLLQVSNKQTAIYGLDNREYYAALIIPKDFSQKQFSLQSPNPTSPEVEILVNQGMNTMAANIAGQMLNQIVDNISNNLRVKIIKGFEKQGGTLTTKQASLLVSPISKKVTNVNEIGTHSANGNAPVSLIQPLWMSSIIGAAIVFIAINKLHVGNKAERLVARLVQVLVGAVLAFVVGFSLIGVVDAWLGLHIPQFADTAFFATLSYFCFFLMISAVISWLGFRGIGIFAILFFFGIPLLAMPPEFMSSFYRDWVYSWLPMRFSVEGLRGLLFFGEGLTMNDATSVLLGIGLVSLIVLCASVLKPNKNNEKEKIEVSYESES